MSKVKVIPCSGIGKVLGLLARESALMVTGVLSPDCAEIACLAHIVTGDEDAKAKVANCACITVDGCPALCAAKSVANAGGTIVAQYRVVDEMRHHKGKQAGDATALTPEGWQVVDALAEKINAKVREANDNG